jgi:hypothetical protein
MCHNSERKSKDERHSLPGEDKSGQIKKVCEKGALTVWRAQKEGQVRALKESERTKDTHSLGSAKAETIQNGEIKQERERHLHTRERRGTSQESKGM